MKKYSACPNCGDTDNGTKIKQCPACFDIVCDYCNGGRGTASHNNCTPIATGKRGPLKTIGVIENNSSSQSSSDDDCCLCWPFQLVGFLWKLAWSLLFSVFVLAISILILLPIKLVVYILTFSSVDWFEDRFISYLPEIWDWDD